MDTLKLFTVLPQSDSRFSFDNETKTHLAESKYSMAKYGEAAYFVPVKLLKNNSDISDKDLFTPVTFPQSQYFMEEKYETEIHLINDEHGREEYGYAAYFVPLLIYRELF